MRIIRTTLILSTILFLCIAGAQAQGVYVRAFGGYAIGASPSLLPGYLQSDLFENETALIIEKPAHNLTESNNNSILVEEFIRDSYGKGLNAGLSIGYMFNKHIGAEVGVSFLSGGKIEYRTEFKDINTIIDFTSKINTLQINPAVVLTTGSDKVSPYARLGLLIGAVHRVKTTAVSTTDDFTIEDELKGKPSFGASAAFGVNFNMSDNILIFAEAEYKGISYTPETREVVNLIDGGVTIDPADIYSHPTQGLVNSSDNGVIHSFFDKKTRSASSFSVSSIGLNIGVKFALGGSGSGPRSR